MQTIASKFRLLLTVLLISFCIHTNAQTPADDPGIGGPGSTGSAPAGDGAPIVPFNTHLNLVLLATGIYYCSKKLRLKMI